MGAAPRNFAARLTALLKSHVTNTGQSIVVNGGGVPCGTIIGGIWTTPPDGYLICDGAEYNITDYYQLFDILKNIDATVRETWGSADWINTFNVPDLRGEFLRGSGTNSHTNSGNGSTPGDHQVATSVTTVRTDDNYGLYVGVLAGGANGDANPDTYTNAGIRKVNFANNTTIAGGGWLNTMTVRPTNTSVLYCIKV